MIFILPLIICLILSAFHIHTRYSRRGKLYRKIPGPTPYPLVGNLPMFSMTCLHQLFNKVHDTIKIYYPTTSIWFVTSPVVNACHPDDMEILLTHPKCINKGFAYEYFRPWLRNGLFISKGEHWRQRRKILTPSFHFGILTEYLDVINEEGEKMVRALEKDGDEAIRNLEEFCPNLALNIICEATMGVSLEKFDAEMVRKYKKAVHDMAKVVVYRLLRPYISNWMMPFIWNIGRLQRNALKVLHTFSDQVLKERREYHRSTNNKYLNAYSNKTDNTTYSRENVDTGLKKRLASLDLLLSVEQKGLIDDDGIKEEIDTLAFGGHDTIGTVMMYYFLIMAEHKDVQDQARAEVTEILDQTKGKMAVAEIQKFQYLERCLKETMRLYPPGALIMRYVSEDVQLKNAIIPADTHIVLHVYETHRDPDFWTEPEKFDPDRFLPEHSRDRHPYAYLPFSAGQRNCLGQKFAMMEMKVLAARILYDFYLEPIDRIADLRLTANVTLQPLDPVRVKFIKINK